MLVQLRNWFFYHTPEDGGGDPASVPGAGEGDPGSSPGTPAEAQPTDTPGGAPGPVPYSRFKEVNDQKNQLAERVGALDEMAQLGYTADDFRRLATWEQEYLQNPTDVWVEHALTQIQDLPPDVKAALETYQAAKAAGNAESQPAPGADPNQPPPWAQEILEKERRREAAEAQQATSGALDSLIAAWKQLDEQQGIQTPEKAMLTYIAGFSDAGDLPSILRGAREEFLSHREDMLKGAVQPMRSGTTPPSAVPGSGAGSALAAAPVRPRTLAEATRLAEEADQRGDLVMTD